jgi:hypothetical protein
MTMFEDPTEMARRLDELDVRLERMARDYAELDRASESLRISETDPTGAITVTVDAQGQLLEMSTTPAVARLAPEQVGPRILACVKRAQARIADRMAELARQTVGTDGMGTDGMGTDEMATHVVNTLRERFPEPEDPQDSGNTARTTAGPGVMKFGGDELYDEPPPRMAYRQTVPGGGRYA